MIDKITGLNGMRNLKILSIGRNYIKTISGLVSTRSMSFFPYVNNVVVDYERSIIFQECVADSLEELWMSYNFVEKLKGINVLKKLRVFYLSNNLVKDWVEFNRLQEVTTLEELLFVGNPLPESMEESVWKIEAARRLPFLKKLDGETVVREESSSIEQENK